jgi:GDPmannose 4,6-dehydratase
MVKNYREGYKLFACNGILFNHEGERRGEDFVSRKITKHVAMLAALQSEGIPQCNWPKLKLGNLAAYRDWGYAPDFVEAMWLMLQQPTADDYVIGTGQTHSVSEFLTEAFEYGLGYYSEELVEIDALLRRPTEVNYLCADYSKAQSVLGWQPKVDFYELVHRMVNGDKNGYNITSHNCSTTG